MCRWSAFRRAMSVEAERGMSNGYLTTVGTSRTDNEKGTCGSRRLAPKSTSQRPGDGTDAIFSFLDRPRRMAQSWIIMKRLLKLALSAAFCLGAVAGAPGSVARAQEQ